PVASFTVAKLRWLATHEPAHAVRVARVLLPHDWLTWRLAGAPAAPTTDRGDASGTGYFSPSTGQWRHDLLPLALAPAAALPRVLPTRPGRWPASPTRREQSPGSPTRPGGTCRWSAPSTRPGSSPPPRPCSASTWTASPPWRSRHPPVRAGWSCCPTSTASGP